MLLTCGVCLEIAQNWKNWIFPAGIRELKQGVFSGCKNLQRVAIPQSVESISRYAFTGCDHLQWVECEAPERFEAAFLDTPYWRNTHNALPGRKRLPLELVGHRSGKLLNERGYSFFSPERSYSIGLPGEDGIVEVTAYVSEDGPDEDGFGREVYFDWWLLDESLEPIDGVPMWHEYSNLDMRNREAEWKQLREKAAEQVSRREK